MDKFIVMGGNRLNGEITLHAAKKIGRAHV